MATVSLAGIDLNANLFLDGIEDKPPVFSSVRPLLGSNNVVQILPNISGAALELVATPGNPRVGHFCQHQLDALQSIANIGSAVTLVHPRIGTTQVFILGFNTDELEVREPVAPNKQYSGSIILQEI